MFFRFNFLRFGKVWLKFFKVCFKVCEFLFLKLVVFGVLLIFIEFIMIKCIWLNGFVIVIIFKFYIY